MRSGRESGISIYGFYEREIAQYRSSQGELLSRNRNECYDGQRIPKGYGTQFYVKSSVRMPRVEQMGMARVTQRSIGPDAYSGKSGELKESFERATTWQKLNRTYCGVRVRKQFGELGTFEGVVQYVHFKGEEFCARVFYEENGDTEDTTIGELRILTHADRATQDGFLKMGSVRRGMCGQVSSINKPLITTCERTPVLESAREMNKVRVVGVNSSSMVIETVTYRKTETLPFVFETKLELFIEPARPLQSNLHSPPVIVRKAVSGPPGLPKPDSTFFEQAETTTQLWHIVQVGNDCLGTVAREHIYGR